MPGKFTYSKPITVWDISAADNARQIATSAREIVHIKLISSQGSAHVAIYDSSDGSMTPTSKVWVLDSSTTTNDDNAFDYPLSFSKGIYAVCENGANFNPKLCIAYLSDQV